MDPKMMSRIGHYGRRAALHWKEHRPKMYRDLDRRGVLEEHLYEAGEKTGEEVYQLIRKGFQVHEAEEIVLPKYVLLPSEDDEPSLVIGEEEGENNP